MEVTVILEIKALQRLQFIFHHALLLITKKKEKKKRTYSSFLIYVHFPSLNEKYYISFEKDFIQEENTTKFSFLSFFSMNIYVNTTFCFFHHITQ